MSFWDKTVQTKVGCSLVSVAHVHLGQTIRNRLGLLFCFSCSCHFGIKQFKQKSVALLCRLLFCVGCSFVSVALLCRLLMFIWVKPLEIDMGCSVAHVHLGQTIRNRHGLLGCSCPFGSNH